MDFHYKIFLSHEILNNTPKLFYSRPSSRIREGLGRLGKGLVNILVNSVALPKNSPKVYRILGMQYFKEE